jgi:glycosyltransferase involved in cell wall biosynthesis
LPEGDLVKLRERERDLHRLADYSIVVSQEERAELHALYDLDVSRIGLVAVMQDIYPKGIAVPFAQRRDICFVGSPHPSNLQAIHYFLREVFPIVAQEAPDIRLHVLGKGMEQAGIDVPMGFADKVEIVGPVADMLVAVAQYRLQVVPIRDGSGIKGKLVESLACNTPVVTTSPGLRGMPARDVEEFLCADDPREFADCVIRLHSDAALWSRQADFGRRFVEKNFSSAVFQDHVYSLMRTIRRADTVDR